LYYNLIIFNYKHDDQPPPIFGIDLVNKAPLLEKLQLYTFIGWGWCSLDSPLCPFSSHLEMGEQSSYFRGVDAPVLVVVGTACCAAIGAVTVGLVYALTCAAAALGSSVGMLALGIFLISSPGGILEKLGWGGELQAGKELFMAKVIGVLGVTLGVASLLLHNTGGSYSKGCFYGVIALCLPLLADLLMEEGTKYSQEKRKRKLTGFLSLHEAEIARDWLLAVSFVIGACSVMCFLAPIVSRYIAGGKEKAPICVCGKK
jgi:hypothetical protein